jgi:hypothetical protein
MFASLEPQKCIVNLPSAGMPADLGLASLGLVMQLAGRASGALTALLASVVVLESRVHQHAWFGFAVALCLARSELHRLAGRDLVYSRRTSEGERASPFGAMRTYIAFGIGHAIVLGLIAAMLFGTTSGTAAGIAAALALWPMVLAGLLLLPRFRPFHAGIPLGEDRGLEGASILMTVFGACGVLSTGAIIAMLGELPSRHLQHGWGVMLVVVFSLLLVRSCLHLRAGLCGLREVSFDRPGELASRYVSFGIVSAACVAGVLALLAMSEQLTPDAIASVVVMGWLLAVWPLIVKRYFHHRQFAELLAGDRVLHRRATDSGLTGLGWLMVGHATLAVTLLILSVTVEPSGAGRALGNLLSLVGPILGPERFDLGLTTGVVVLELVAAVSLLRMSKHRKVITTIYAFFASGTALAVAWPLVQSLGHHHISYRSAFQWIPTAVQLVVPTAVMTLVHRKIAPVAQARYREPSMRPRRR